MVAHVASAATVVMPTSTNIINGITTFPHITQVLKSKNQIIFTSRYLYK